MMRESLADIGEISDDQWRRLLERMEAKIERIDNGLEQASEKALALEKSVPLVFILEFLLVVIFIMSALVFLYLGVVALQLRAQRKGNMKHKSHKAVQALVRRTLGAPTDRATAQSDPRDAVVCALQTLIPLSARDSERVDSTNSTEYLEGMREDECPTNSLAGAMKVWTTRIRQRAMAGQGQDGLPGAKKELREALPSSAPEVHRLPDRAGKSWRLLSDKFRDPDDQSAILTALHAATDPVHVTSDRWMFKEASLQNLLGLGADARAVSALLLHDLDECLGVPWSTVAKEIANCPVLGDEVVCVITEKKRLEQLGLLLYLRTMAQEPTVYDNDERDRWPAVMQLTRLLYLQHSEDFRGAMVEIAEINQMLRDLSLPAQYNDLGFAAECWALSRVVLDLYAPLAHGLGLDVVGSPNGRAYNDRLLPSMEQTALRLHFPDEYRMIEEWMLQEDELLNRTLRRCIMEVKESLLKDDGFTGLASFVVNGRVKSVFSLVKKLLRQRETSRTDLKTDAVKDLLALEVIVTPDEDAEVPRNPQWLAEEWRERAACFAALFALQRYARETKGWWILPDSTKDYITKSKKSGYRALHITLGTNVSAVLPKASSAAVSAARVAKRMICKLEVHIFSKSMKQREQAGTASHHLYKAFELSSEEVFTNIRGDAVAKLTPSDVASRFFPAGRMKLASSVFTADCVAAEFEELFSTSDRDHDGLLSFSDVRRAQQQVSLKLEDFRRALEHQKNRWWVTGVHASAAVPKAGWGRLAGSLTLQDKLTIIERALEVTQLAHQGQKRKSGEPYWTHPLTVADILARLLLPPNPTTPPDLRTAGSTEELEADARALWHRVAAAPEDVFAMYIAALLHDTVEDTSMTIPQIKSMFGHNVSFLVDGVTKASSERSSRASRTARDLKKVLERASADPRVLVIKFADRLHNMRTLEHMPNEKQRRIAEETRAAYVPLADRLGIHLWKTELEELCCRYLNGYAYDVTVEENHRTHVARMRNLRYIQQYVSTLVVDWLGQGSILSITMEEEPVHTQLKRWAARSGSSSPTPPTPVPRMKVVTKDKDFCWQCLGKIHGLFPPMPGRLKDYISSPKENLYHCIHTVVLMDGAPVEVYIKSLEMDWVGEFGVGAYWRHNEELQRSDMGRVLQEALRSTWLREATDTLEQTLQRMQAASPKDDKENTYEGDILQPNLTPLMDQVRTVATGSHATIGSESPTLTRTPTPPLQHDTGSDAQRSVHRSFFEALKEKVTVFTPTGRVVFLPRDATALDFAVWNLGPQKGLSAETALIDGLPASLHTKLCEGQTVLVNLREDANMTPPREWAGVHLRYLRTKRARNAFVEMRAGLLTQEQALKEGTEALHTELLLHSLDENLLSGLGDEVLTAIGRGELPAELVSASFLAAQVAMPEGDMDYVYAADGLGDNALEEETRPEEMFTLSFMLVARDRSNLLYDVVEVVRQHKCDMTAFFAQQKQLSDRPEDVGSIFVASVKVDNALRFGSIMHTVRHCTHPLLIERIPVELAASPVGRQPQPRASLGAWMQEVPEELKNAPLFGWKTWALQQVTRPQAATSDKSEGIGEHVRHLDSD